MTDNFAEEYDKPEHYDYPEQCAHYHVLRQAQQRQTCTISKTALSGRSLESTDNQNSPICAKESAVELRNYLKNLSSRQSQPNSGCKTAP
jgi:hypothetical protein